MIRRTARTLLGGAAAAVDRAATLAAYAGSARARRKSRAESLSHDDRLAALAAIAELYRPALRGGFFREPRPIRPAERRVHGRGSGVRVVDLSWPSDFHPYLPRLADRYASFAENRHAAARLFLGREPRPMAILIHGYMAGQYALEQRVWPLEWLDRLGLDAALFVLPFHGVRSDARRKGPPPFPSSDPRMSNEGFRQAMGDFRDLVAWLRARGHPAVGVMGMSLGGYTTALAATVEPELAFAVPIIPLASLADFARDQGRLGATGGQTAQQHRALDEVHRVVSPLHRAPLVEPARALVVGARADRITPISHARRIAEHFGAPLQTWHGGHLLQFGRADQFRRIGRLLDHLGLTRR